jgi:sterol desaturase/sphingolipid hydroxylase (fatty acid hydroxylase superfamily)
MLPTINFLLHNPTSWSNVEIGIFFVLVIFAQTLLAYLVPFIFQFATKIPIKKDSDGKKEIVKVLYRLETIDYIYIGFNELMTALFGYHINLFLWNSSNVEWDFDKLSFRNTIFALVALYLSYDFVYTNFHRLLHVRGLYKYIHKHHHRQMAPFRGTFDAINVHPIEFTLGEYLHLLCLYFVPTHIVTLFLFVIMDGVFASLNHTRFLIFYSSLLKNFFFCVLKSMFYFT